MQAFSALGTQWRSAGFGATGLDYTAIPVVLEMHGVPPEDRREIFEQIRIMEDAALSVMIDQAKKQKHG